MKTSAPTFVCTSVRGVLQTVFLLLSKEFGSEIQFKFWNAVYCFVFVVYGIFHQSAMY